VTGSGRPVAEPLPVTGPLPAAEPLLVVDDLHARVGETEILSGVSLRLERGAALGLVGETGAGKTMTVRAVTGLLRRAGGRVTSGSVRLAGQDLTGASDRAWRRWQGRTVALVPQASMSSLDPLQRIGRQFHGTIRGAGRGAGRRADVAAETARLLESVHLDASERLLRAYPHELSGGMRQRVMIGLALATRPALLVADEPTTALDAAIRGEILALLTQLRRDRDLALLLVSHDLSAIEAATDTTAVMYAGRTVETGPTRQLVSGPAHPYTRALLDSRPERTPPGRPLPVITGRPAVPGEIGQGCPFAPRCPAAMAACVSTAPATIQIDPRRSVACIKEPT
jgi:oligopeptide/dipeptide ABC transporter ATP-binding protein